ncbi:hypothetical protein ACFL3G_08080 [Planctomycetota bacterium]
MFNLFEQPWTLVGVGVIAVFCLWLFRVFFPDKWRWRQLGIPVLIVLLGFGLDWLVDSDSERIDTLIETMITSIREERPLQFESIVSENYADSVHSSKDSFMQYVNARLSKPAVESAYEAIISEEMGSRSAEIVMTIRFVFDKEGEVYQSFVRLILAKIKLELVKENDGRWLIESIEVRELNKQPTKWRDIRTLRW